MHHRVQTIIDILDGKPRGFRGQSFIELALTMPVLVLMIMALAEIGFVANNYLILMDLVRESGRRGANLNPTLWNETQTRNYERLDCDNVAHIYNFDNSLQAQATPRRLVRGPSAAFGYSNVYDNPDPAFHSDPPFGFFDAVVCQGAFSIAPLEFEDQDWGTDGMTASSRANLFAQNDIVVSAFSYARLDFYATNRNGVPLLDDSRKGPRWPEATGPQKGIWVTVTGRYPMANRFCKAADGTGDARDPFDFKRSEFYQGWHNGAAVPDTDEINAANDPYRLTDASQQVRGFVFTGQAVNDNGCLGSRFTVQDIEQRLNADLATAELVKKVPNGGLVLVEYFWQHHPLFLGSLFQGFTYGDVSRDPVLYLYGVFPTLGAQPTATPDS